MTDESGGCLYGSRSKLTTPHAKRSKPGAVEQRDNVSSARLQKVWRKIKKDGK